MALPVGPKGPETPELEVDQEVVKKIKAQADGPLKRHVTEVYTLTVPPLAKWFDRALSALIDIAILFTPTVVAVLIAASASPDVSRVALYGVILSGILLSVGVFFGQAWLEGTMGQSVGKMILGLVVVDHENASLVGWRRAISRSVTKYLFDVIPGGTGARAIANDKQGQSRGDEAAGTVVVYTVRRPKGRTS